MTKRFMLYRIICLVQINEAGIEKLVELKCFLHQYSQRDELVSTALAITETTLVFAKELFCSGLEPVQDGFSKHLDWYAEKSNTTVVVAGDSASLIVQWHERLTLLVPGD